jgi:hypothetical protein
MILNDIRKRETQEDIKTKNGRDSREDERMRRISTHNSLMRQNLILEEKPSSSHDLFFSLEISFSDFIA